MVANRNRRPDAMFWAMDWVARNASTGLQPLQVPASEWHHIAIEVGQAIRNIVGVNYDGMWHTEIDSEVTTRLQLTTLVFRGNAANTAASMTPLYIDNLLIEDNDART